MTVNIISKMPWAGLISVAGMVASLISSALIVVASKDDAVSSWSVQPAVLLAIFSGISGLLFASALESGIAIQFWLHASEGTPISQLHYIWNHGRGLGLFGALRAGSKARTVALLATAAYLMQFLAGPFLQRCTYQTVREDVVHESLSVDIAERIPDGWFGDKDGYKIFEFRHGFPQIQDWWRKAPIATKDKAGYACNGNCTGYVKGAGFTYQCWTTTQEQLDLSTPSTDDNTVFLVTSRIAQNTTGPPFLRLLTKYVSHVDAQCLGTLQVETCHLSSATVEYPITIQNSAISLLPGSPHNIRVIAPSPSPGDAPSAPENAPAGPLLGLSTFASTPLSDNATKVSNPQTNRAFYMSPGTLSDIFFVSPKSSSSSSSDNDDEKDRTPEKCNLRWTRPTDYVLAAMYDYMFRCALAAAVTNNNSTHEVETQRSQVLRTSQQQVFQVHAGFLAASMTVLACGVLFVGALLWNWWLLGRPVTLSPLETVAALGSPVMEGKPEATIGQILRGVADGEVVRRGTWAGEREVENRGFGTKGVVEVVEIIDKGR